MLDGCRAGGYKVRMATTVKQSIVLTKPQSDFLKEEAERLGISAADLIRRIIDRYREDRS
jgi:hypothetical protein